MQQQVLEQSIYDRRKLELRKTQKRLKLLIIIGVLLLILFSIVLYASFKKGGFSNLTKGDQDIVSNTIKNIGTSFVEDKEQEENNKKYITPVDLPTPTDEEKKQAEALQDYISINNFENNYEISVKKGSFVYFMNQTSARFGFKFSDGRDLKLNSNEEQNIIFPKKGDITFFDQLDSTPDQVHGTIHVTD